MCGFVGVISSNTRKVVRDTKYYLGKLSHRGQSSAGIATFSSDFSINSFKANGGIDVLEQYNEEAKVAIGHLRYPTIGSVSNNNIQPFTSQNPGLILAHNGQIINYLYLKNILKEQGISLTSNSDIEPVLFLISKYLSMESSVSEYNFVKVITEMFKLVRGAFSFVGASKIDNALKMFCVRDPYGFRPLFLAKKRNGDYVCASENVAFAGEDFEEFEELKRGELVLLANNYKKSFIIDQKTSSFCAFELIYFSHPNTVYEGKTVYKYREELGQGLSEIIKRKKINPDFISGIPSSSYPMASALAEKLKLPYKQAFIKNASYRTFIVDSRIKQRDAVLRKLTPIVDIFNGKKVLLLDDSLVRGTTIKAVVDKIRMTSMVEELHIVIASPPVLYPCYYGIDIATESELFARNFFSSSNSQEDLEKNMAEYLGVNSVSYLPVKLLEQILGKNKCMACFNGKYPLSSRQECLEYIKKDSLFRRSIYENN